MDGGPAVLRVQVIAPRSRTQTKLRSQERSACEELQMLLARAPLLTPEFRLCAGTGRDHLNAQNCGTSIHRGGLQLALVAVGTILTDRPPHRSVRARLRIR